MKTQDDLAQASGLSLKIVNELEGDNGKNPLDGRREGTVVWLARTLRVNPADLEALAAGKRDWIDDHELVDWRAPGYEPPASLEEMSPESMMILAAFANAARMRNTQWIASMLLWLDRQPLAVKEFANRLVTGKDSDPLSPGADKGSPAEPDGVDVDVRERGAATVRRERHVRPPRRT